MSKGHARGSCTEKEAVYVPCARKGHKRTHRRAADCPVYAAILRKARERISEDSSPVDAAQLRQEPCGNGRSKGIRGGTRD